MNNNLPSDKRPACRQHRSQAGSLWLRFVEHFTFDMGVAESFANLIEINEGASRRSSANLQGRSQ